MCHKYASIRTFLAAVMLGGILFSTLVACNTSETVPPVELPTARPTAESSLSATSAPPATAVLPTADEVDTAVNPTAVSPTAPPAQTDTPIPVNADISFDINAATTAVSPHILGTNIPSWLNPARLSNPVFQTEAAASGTTLYRIPGGSWSNEYNWLACERGGEGIDANDSCRRTWAARPTDFINLLRITGGDVMYTVNLNGTAKEAAAAVAFFNGSTDDDTVIGVDVRGRDWGSVSDWAQLRSDNGNPDPLYVKYWEVGNEIYGGKPNSGTGCDFQWGWEDVWTCDGREYVNGIGSGANRHEGFLEFRAAMQQVDPTILVGAVGVSPQDGWGNWGNEVIEEAGAVMDFYIIHRYAFSNPLEQKPPATYDDVLTYPQSHWPSLMADATAAFAQYANGRQIPIAITEHNLVSIQEKDNGQWMTRAVNMLFMADTIGQMMENGISAASQWNLANGRPANGTDYGLIDAETYALSPQYYVFPIWNRFGTELLPVTSIYAADTTLSVYAGKADENVISLLAINKTGEDITANIQMDGVSALVGGTVDVAQADSLDAQVVQFNGVQNPSDILTTAPSLPLTDLQLPFSYTFPPYSVVLLRLEIGE